MGTAGWTDRSLIASGWYPADANTPEKRLRYLQFPPWFPISRANKDYILACAQRAAPRRVCVEFRDYAHVNARQLADRLSI